MNPAPQPTDVLVEATRRLPIVGRLAICHVVEVSGSVPCKSGWKKLIDTEGNAFGNLGGGAFEARVLNDAVAMLGRGDRSLRERYYLTEASTKGVATGMNCGGYAEVWMETLTANPVALVCGGGPVGQAVATQAALCGFDVVVAEDREEFRLPEDFPAGTEFVCLERAEDKGGQDEGGQSSDWSAAIGARDVYVAVVSRSWETDTLALNRVARDLTDNLCYVGLMGSQRKVKRVRAALEDTGIHLQSLHAPIGLEIGAQTPAELAVSIVGEMIAIRRRDESSP